MTEITMKRIGLRVVIITILSFVLFISIRRQYNAAQILLQQKAEMKLPKDGTVDHDDNFFDVEKDAGSKVKGIKDLIKSDQQVNAKVDDGMAINDEGTVDNILDELENDPKEDYFKQAEDVTDEVSYDTTTEGTTQETLLDSLLDAFHLRRQDNYIDESDNTNDTIGNIILSDDDYNKEGVDLDGRDFNGRLIDLLDSDNKGDNGVDDGEVVEGESFILDLTTDLTPKSLYPDVNNDEAEADSELTKLEGENDDLPEEYDEYTETDKLSSKNIEDPYTRKDYLHMVSVSPMYTPSKENFITNSVAIDNNINETSTSNEKLALTDIGYLDKVKNVKQYDVQSRTRSMFQNTSEDEERKFQILRETLTPTFLNSLLSGKITPSMLKYLQLKLLEKAAKNIALKNITSYLSTSNVKAQTYSYPPPISDNVDNIDDKGDSSKLMKGVNEIINISKTFENELNSSIEDDTGVSNKEGGDDNEGVYSSFISTTHPPILKIFNNNPKSMYKDDFTLSRTQSSRDKSNNNNVEITTISNLKNEIDTNDPHSVTISSVIPSKSWLQRPKSYTFSSKYENVPAWLLSTADKTTSRPKYLDDMNVRVIDQQNILSATKYAVEKFKKDQLPTANDKMLPIPSGNFRSLNIQSQLSDVKQSMSQQFAIRQQNYQDENDLWKQIARQELLNVESSSPISTTEIPTDFHTLKPSVQVLFQEHNDPRKPGLSYHNMLMEQKVQLNLPSEGIINMSVVTPLDRKFPDFGATEKWACPREVKLGVTLHPVTALVAFPGDDTMWVRNILEQLFGETTDNIYDIIADLSSRNAKRVYHMSRNIAIQTHSMVDNNFERALVVIRNPFSVEEKHRLFRPEYVDWQKKFLWGDTYASWLSSPLPVHIVMYEDLVESPVTELLKIVDFLSNGKMKISYKCALLVAEKPPKMVDDWKQITGIYYRERNFINAGIDKVLEVARLKFRDLVARLESYKV